MTRKNFGVGVALGGVASAIPYIYICAGSMPRIVMITDDTTVINPFIKEYYATPLYDSSLG
jgi:hypothetical protein